MATTAERKSLLGFPLPQSLLRVPRVNIWVFGIPERDRCCLPRAQRFCTTALHTANPVASAGARVPGTSSRTP